MNNPSNVISIVIPCWNTAAYLPQTLSSIASQTFQNFEVLMVDDGSTDDTWRIMQQWATADRRFRPIKQPCNQGLVAARNAALAVASGEFVAMLDGDDIWTPDALEVRVSVAERFPGADVIATDFSWFSDEISGEPVGRVSLGPRAKAALAECYATSRPVLLSEPFEMVATLHFAWVGATLVRRAAMARVGNFDPQFKGPEDTLLWLKLAQQGAFAFAPRVTAHYRQRVGSIVNLLREPKEFHYLKVLDCISPKPEFRTYRPFMRGLMAECHHVCGIHFRRKAEWDRARFHATQALKFEPTSMTYWREATAVWLRLS